MDLTNAHSSSNSTPTWLAGFDAATPAPREGRTRPGRPKAEFRTSPVFEFVPLDSIRLAPVNDAIYGRIDPNDPALDSLVESLREFKQWDQIILSADRVIISGHRRYAAAKRLGWTAIKATFQDILSTDPWFPAFVVSCNESQRDKTPDVKVREQLVLTDPDDAHAALVSERAERAKVMVAPIVLGIRRKRSTISAAKMPFLRACQAIIDAREEYWPLSDRQIHYALLNDPPLIHAKKPDSNYRNDRKSYKAVCDLLTRARLAGHIPFEAIGDETRPVVTWNAHPSVAAFARKQLDKFMHGYWRDLMQGQPNHVEIVGEKMTVQGIIRPIAADFRIPYTVGRGYSSLPPRKAICDRYVKSGKSKLVLLFLSDFDPEGVDIPESFSKSMRDDFGVEDIHPIKVGLKADQIAGLNLPPNADVKSSSSRYAMFKRRHGTAVYELEAAPPVTIQRWLRESIEAVIDTDAFNAQVEAEMRDAATAATYRKAGFEYFTALKLGDE